MTNRNHGRIKWGILWLLLLVNVAPVTDAAGDLIDKTNWKKVQGLVPDPLLDYIKNGEFVMNVVELNYNPAEYFPSFVLDSFEKNVGRYALDEKKGVVDVETGETPKRIMGYPFPEIDVRNDLKAADKIMYNQHWGLFSLGSKSLTMNIAWVGRSGFEREVSVNMMEIPFIAWPGADKFENTDGRERMVIMRVLKPFDMAGTAIMNWRYLDNRKDLNFSYVPAIRRVRRMSPANRSDSFLGSDMAADDSTGYDGKIDDMEWRLVREQDVLAVFHGRDVIPLVRGKKALWETTEAVKPIRYGYQEEGWIGAAWCPLSVVYAKRPAWVIEAKPKDPYYNSGAQYLWIDRETFSPLYKMVHDRQGSFWKYACYTIACFEGNEPANPMNKLTGWMDHLFVDNRREHGTYVKLLDPDAKLYINVEINPDDFTLAGFQKYCK